MILAAQWIFFLSYVNHDSSGGLVGASKGTKGSGEEKKIYKAS